MKLNDFERYLDIYGSHLFNWPASLSSKANALLIHSAEAQTLLLKQQMLEDQLSQLKIPEFSPDLIDRILQQTYHTPQIKNLTWKDRLHHWFSASQARHYSAPLGVTLALILLAVPFLPSTFLLHPNWDKKIDEVADIEQKADAEKYALDVLHSQSIEDMLDDLIDTDDADEIYNTL
ncbi:MAG: hypothetical protein IPP74_07610 [Alphaproteobacteria bacterium]|nr:hypothetical protein [Alphaproteobacteria bacterium]